MLFSSCNILCIIIVMIITTMMMMMMTPNPNQITQH